MVFALSTSAIIVALFAFYTLKFLSDYKKTLVEIDIVQKAVDEIDKENLYLGHFNVQEYIKRKITKTQNDLLKYWIEFEESLVISDEYIDNTLDAEHFFNERNLAHRIFQNKTYENASQIYVGLGVLFTFTGLVYGLWGITLDSENIEVLKNGIEQLITGAQTAFFSSIVGIFLSLLFNLIYYKRRSEISNKILELQKSINFKYPRTNPEKSLAYIRDSSKESSVALGALSEQLGEKLQQVVRDISGEISKGIQDSISPYMEQIANKAMNASESVLGDMMDEFLKKVTQAADEQQKLILETNQTIQESLIEFRTQFTGQVIELKDVITNLNESYHFIQEHLISQFDHAIEQFSDAVNSYKDEQRSFILQLQEQASVVEKLNQISSEIERMMGNIDEQVSMSVSAYRQATDNLVLVYESNNEASNKLTEAADSFEQPLRALEEQYESLQSIIQNTTATIQRELEQALKGYFTQVEDQTTERLREWNNQTTAFSTAMLSVTTQMNSLVESISDNLEGRK